MPTPRAELLEGARAAAILEARQKAHPLAYVRLWDQAEPRTSQRRAFAEAFQPDVEGVVVVGGNGTGKTFVAAVWAHIQALGADHPDVIRFAQLNGLDLSHVPTGPGIVWVASPTFGAAKEQIRPHLKDLAPEGARYKAWASEKQAELILPGGGRIISKAYSQYADDPDTWEGATIRAVIFDEQPVSQACMVAGFSRTRTKIRPGVKQRSRCFWGLFYTGLRGKDWLYYQYAHKPTAQVPVRWIHAADNPHLDQVHQAKILANVPAWQRPARERGEFVSPVGRRLPAFDRAIHVLQPGQMPEFGPRWLGYAGVDPGARHPHILWIAESPQGDLFVHSEYAPRLATSEPGLADDEVISTAKAWEARIQKTDKFPVVRYRVTDSANQSFLTAAARARWVCIAAEKGAGSIEEGLDLIESFLATSWLGMPRMPRLFISSECPVLINELEQLQWLPEQPGKEPMTDPACEDDGIDDLRYVLRFRRSIGRS